MLTKIGVAALLGTIGTAAVGGTASANEPCRTPVTVAAPVAVARPVIVAAPPIASPIVTRVDYRYGEGSYGTPGVYYRHDRREELARMRREQEARRHAEWLRRHGHRF
jgi:hypothetical protein